MKSMKNILALMLALTMVLCLCACAQADQTQNDNSSSSSSSSETKDSSSTPADSDPEDPAPVDYLYTVTVKDTTGKAISGLQVEICGATTVTATTDANGVAGFDTAVEGELTAKIAVPEGYVGMEEIAMGDQTDVSFALTNVTNLVYTVTIQDTEGNPIAGIWTQICAGESCTPVVTDANGIAGYTSVIEGDGVRTAKIVNVPTTDYEAVDGITEIEMGEDTEVVFVLRALQ